VFDVPLLVESGRWRDRVDWVLAVDCPEEVQIERVVRRSHWTPDEVRRVMAQQAPRLHRRAAADAVIDNRRDTLDALQSAVDALWRHWIIGGR
jgi:dephospho-CoA kinase